MDIKRLEKLLLPDSRSKYRSLIWRTIGQYSIEPPQRFCGIEVLSSARSQDDPLAFRVGGTSVYAELKNLNGVDMIEPVTSDDPYSRVNWFARTDPEAWAVAFQMIKETT